MFDINIKTFLRTTFLRGPLLTIRNLLLFRSYTLGRTIHFIRVGKLHVCTTDNRANILLHHKGVTQPAITYLWRKIVNRFSPNLVLDIGANYGEIVLSTKYPTGATIFAFEPNPNIIPYLRKSVESHKNSKTIRIIDRLVSNEERTYSFFVDKKWSGTSSAAGKIFDKENKFKGEGEECFEKIKVTSLVIDNFISENVENCKLDILFKIDVEGFESNVFLGMSKTLASANKFFGIIEFDSELLKKAGSDPQQFLDSLAKMGVVKIFNENGEIIDAKHIGKTRTHTNLIVTSDVKMLEGIRIPYSIR